MKRILQLVVLFNLGFSFAESKANDPFDLVFQYKKCVDNEVPVSRPIYVEIGEEKVYVTIKAAVAGGKKVTTPKVRGSVKGITLSVRTEIEGESFTACFCNYEFKFEFRKDGFEEVLTDIYFVIDDTVKEAYQIEKTNN